jgi:hypothetical protein
MANIIIETTEADEELTFLRIFSGYVAFKKPELVADFLFDFDIYKEQYNQMIDERKTNFNAWLRMVQERDNNKH